VALRPHPTLVCFDLGGVLVRICSSWAEACAAAGLELRDVEHFGAEATARARRALADRYQSGEIECEAYYRSTHELLRGAYSAAEVEKIHAAWTLDEYTGVRELVAALNATPELETACLSNTNHAHWQLLVSEERYRGVQSLGHRLASHILRCAKPNPEIYERARELFGRAPHEIIFFDDLPENVAAAARAGWRAVGIDPKGDTVAQIRRELAEAGLELG
jgi:HAD superfamily hydrolase (TIGR01509 family)